MACNVVLHAIMAYCKSKCIFHEQWYVACYNGMLYLFSVTEINNNTFEVRCICFHNNINNFVDKCNISSTHRRTFWVSFSSWKRNWTTRFKPRQVSFFSTSQVASCSCCNIQQFSYSSLLRPLKLSCNKKAYTREMNLPLAVHTVLSAASMTV